MATRGAFLLLRRDMSINTRTIGLPTEAIGRVKPRNLPKNRGGASSAARARLAQVLSTVKEQAVKPAYNQSAQSLPDHNCPSCGATHASDAPEVHKTTPDPVANTQQATPKQTESHKAQLQEGRSRAAEKIAMAAKAAAPLKAQQSSFVDMLPKITVMGVGGAGCNAVNNMISSGIQGVDFVAVNTDAQSLASSLAPSRIQLGELGLGAGARPELGRQAAEETMERVGQQIEGTHLLFITAGMGGGTGTGAAAAIAQMARKRGVLTIGVVSTPWTFEGANRLRMAKAGVAELEHCVDTLITIPNQNLMKIDPKLSMDAALDMADSVLRTGVQGVTDLIVSPGLINLDFADVSTVTQGMGRAIMGTGQAAGEGRAIAAAEAALRNPLLGEVELTDSQGVLISVTGGNNMTLFEVDEVANRIREAVHPEATIIFGASFDEALERELKVSVICTGLRANHFEQHAAAPARKTPLQKDADKKEAQTAGGLMGFLRSIW